MMKLACCLSVLVCVLACVATADDVGCMPKPMNIPSMSLGATIYPNNSISYISLSIPATAASNFNISFRAFNSANITVSVGYATASSNLTCPTGTTYNNTNTGVSFKFTLDNPDVITYYFGLSYGPGANASNSTWVVALLQVGCPDWCSGSGAMCNSQTGCMCMNNYWDEYHGCHVYGECNPYENKTNTCILDQFSGRGYGNQSCLLSNTTNSQWGDCVVAFCNSGYVINVAKNTCDKVCSGSGDSDEDGKLSIPLTKGEFIGAIVGGAAVLVIVTAVITYLTVRRRHHHYSTIH